RGCAQMEAGYCEERAAGVAREAAVRRSFTRLAAPTIAGIMTDALGVLAIAIVAIPALRALALTATLWLLSLIVTELLLNPIVYRHLRAPEVETIRARESGLLARACRRLATAVTRPRRPPAPPPPPRALGGPPARPPPPPPNRR